MLIAFSPKKFSANIKWCVLVFSVTYMLLKEKTERPKIEHRVESFTIPWGIDLA